jgi:hypothetical protein
MFQSGTAGVSESTHGRRVVELKAYVSHHHAALNGEF